MSSFTRWNQTPARLIFPKWVDPMVRLGGLLAALGGGYVTLLVAYGASPKTLDVGYAPKQPIPYSHALHVGQLGLDCRYCHTSVETTAKANIPPTETCWNCHSKVLTKSEKLAPLHESYSSGKPVRWVRVHDLPDYSYFNHSAHVSRGVGCVECHGRVDAMEVVYQAKPLSMAWCVDCHRNPASNLRPPHEATNMTWEPRLADVAGAPAAVVSAFQEAAAISDPDSSLRARRAVFGKWFKEQNGINPSTDCSTCHR